MVSLLSHGDHEARLGNGPLAGEGAGLVFCTEWGERKGISRDPLGRFRFDLFFYDPCTRLRPPRYGTQGVPSSAWKGAQRVGGVFEFARRAPKLR